MMSTIEMAARALCKARGHDPDEVVTPEILLNIDGLTRLPVHGFHAAAWTFYAPMVRTVLEAIRDPALDMRKVCTFEAAEIEWPKMIDAALAQPVTSEKATA